MDSALYNSDDSEDSDDESSVSSDNSSISWDCSSDDSDDEIIDHNDFVRTHTMEGVQQLQSNDRLHDLQDLSFLTGVQQLQNNRWEHTRLDWNAHVKQLQHEGMFENEYLMSLRAHDKLIQILDPFLQRKEYNSRCPEPILVEHIVANGLRIVSGGRPKDQQHIIGTCKDASYKAFIDFINAVNLAPELAIHTPSTSEEWNTIYKQYKRKSSNEPDV